jgi:YHS domain-containing protein
MFLMASGPAKTRMLLQVDRYAFLVVRKGTLVCIVCTVRADFSSPHFAVAGLRCNFLEINRSQRGERNGSCCCPRTNNLQRRVPMMTIDPVCGLEVDEQETELQTQYAGKKYSFCSEECLTAFERQPSLYSRAAAKAA